MSGHCLCYTCVCYYCCYVPLIPELTWTCGPNCWWSHGGGLFAYGENEVVYHKWLCCPWEKWVKTQPGAGAPNADEIAR